MGTESYYFCLIGEMGISEMGVGEMGVGKTGIGETVSPHSAEERLNPFHEVGIDQHFFQVLHPSTFLKYKGLFCVDPYSASSPTCVWSTT